MKVLPDNDEFGDDGVSHFGVADLRERFHQLQSVGVGEELRTRRSVMVPHRRRAIVLPFAERLRR